jgi:putative membrane protein
MVRPSISSLNSRSAGRGLLAGALATVPMSGVIALGWLTGLLRTPPPEEVSANALESAMYQTGDVLELPEFAVAPAFDSPAAFQAGWIVAHLVYGALCGLVFVGLQASVPAAPRRPLGIGFGLLVWLGSYLGLLPALKLYPRPEADSPGRVVTMIVAHVVFGLSLAEFDRQLEARGLHRL